MTAPLTVVYVLVYHGRGRYPVMTHVSASAARRVHPDARLVLVTDEETPPHLDRSHPRLPGLFDEVIPFPADMPELRARSFYLKTRLRDLIAGDFVYLDSDTLPVRPFADVFEREWDVALVQDRNHHCPVTPVYPHWEVPRMKKLGWDNPLPRYFNAGIGFYRDTAAARAVVADWQRRWRQSYAAGDDWDQLALSCAAATVPANVLELPPAYNAMVTVHPAHARGARVYHFFTVNPDAWRQTVFEHLLAGFERTGEIDWAAADRCVAMDHPWLPPYWPRRLWQTGNRGRAVRLYAAKLFRKALGRTA
jgi:hypothetical protein